MDLCLPAFTRQVLAERDDRGAGNGRAVLPQGGEQIRNRDDGHRNVKGTPEIIHGGYSLAQAVHGDDRLRESAGGQPLRDGNLLGHPHLVQLDPRSSQLFHSLDEIPGIRPQAGVVQGDAQVPRLARESGQPLHLFPTLCRIFAGVGIAPRKDDGVPPPFPHLGTEGFYTLRKDVFHGMIIDIFHKYKYICRYLKQESL